MDKHLRFVCKIKPSQGRKTRTQVNILVGIKLNLDILRNTEFLRSNLYFNTFFNVKSRNYITPDNNFLFSTQAIYQIDW